MTGPTLDHRADPGHCPAERTRSIRRATIRLCMANGWAPLPEMGLPDGRRLDLMCLLPDGCLAAVEVKSGARDFLCDAKWPGYRAWCDQLYFAVDEAFPRALLPDDVGLIVVADGQAALLRDAPAHPLAPPRRRALLQRFARLAAGRLFAAADPAGAAELGAGCRLD